MRFGIVFFVCAALALAGVIVWLGPDLETNTPGAASGRRNPDPTPPVPTHAAQPISRSAADSLPPELRVAELVFDVRDASGLPLRDVRVAVYPISHPQEALRGSTAANGELRFVGIPVGAYRYELEAANRPALVGARNITLRADERRVVKLQLDGYALVIEGRVVDARGSAVPGLEVTASPTEIRNGLSGPVRRVTTDGAGHFALRGLDAGEYVLRTKETERHGSVKSVVSAGSSSAVLRVTSLESLQVTGTVRGPQGTTLSGVRVRALGQAGKEATTDSLGRYALIIKAERAGQTHLRFEAEGFRDGVAAWDPSRPGEADITLIPIGQRVAVSGRLTDNFGRPVGGEQVHLFSRRENSLYQTRSDASGAFAFPAVVTADDYRFWVRPKGTHADYTRESLRIADGPVDLSASLEALPVGALAGKVLDSGGSPVPRFGLLAYSALATGRPVQVVTDDHGNFTIPALPVGRLHIKSRTSAPLRIDDIELRSGDNRYVEIVVDRAMRSAQ